MNNQDGGPQAQAGADAVAGSGACAVCRHQRRRNCHPNCQYAEFFPPNRVEEFENAYRLYGVSNIMKIMESVEPEQRRDCAESILIEANIWRNGPPGHGCLGYVKNLMSQIQSSEWEKAAVDHELAYFRGILTQQGQGASASQRRPEDMAGERMDEEHHIDESAAHDQNVNQGESSGVTKAGDKQIAKE